MIEKTPEQRRAESLRQNEYRLSPEGREAYRQKEAIAAAEAQADHECRYDDIRVRLEALGIDPIDLRDYLAGLA